MPSLICCSPKNMSSLTDKARGCNIQANCFQTEHSSFSQPPPGQASDNLHFISFVVSELPFRSTISCKECVAGKKFFLKQSFLFRVNLMKNPSRRKAVVGGFAAACAALIAGKATAAVCSSCQGAGTGPFECTPCKGTGKSGPFKCIFCNGKGFGKCTSCNGTGQK